MSNMADADRVEQNATLQSKVDAQEKVIAALKKRVQKSISLSTAHSSAYYTATNLEEAVKKRTVELEKLNQELTAALENERRLAEARDSALDASAIKCQFLAMMSHEIRTPMNGVIGMTSILLGTELTREQRDCVGVICSSGEALLSIINDILDFSKIEAQKLTLEEYPFDLSDCVSDALDVISTLATDKGLELIFEQKSTLPDTLVSDVTRVRQILVNLLSNAVKFTLEGEIVLSVWSEHISGMKYQLFFEVRDTGIGIPADRLGSLFDAFSQVDASTTRKYGGTGLGLAICRELSILLGGGITVDSEEGAGTAFTFNIAVTAESNEQNVDTRCLLGRKILVVDDNDTTRLILSEQLKSYGIEIVCADSAAQAVRLVESSHAFDAALLDHQMPDKCGMMLAESLSQSEQTQNLPLVMLGSIGGLKGDTQDHIKHWLNKPVMPRNLQKVLMSLFSDSHDSVVTPKKADHAQDTNFSALKVLLVEDNRVNQMVAVKMLQRLGVSVDTVGNGLEALDALQRMSYDIVLMDMMMPEMDGVEATKRIRANEGGCQPIIIALTANAMESDRDTCLNAGMEDYLSKPIKIEELTECLETWGEKLVI